MNRMFTSLALAVALGVGAPSLAQQPDPAEQPPAAEQQPAQPQPAQPQPAQPQPGEQQPALTDVTEDELETFADVYVELQDTVTEYETEMAEVESAEEAQEVQSRMQQQTLETLSEHGWTPEEYNRVAQAINADPALIERVITLVEERS